MSQTSTWAAIRDQLLVERGLTGPEVENRLGYKFTAATITNTTLTTTDPYLIKLGADYFSQRFNSWTVFLAENAETRAVTTMSISSGTATINFEGGNATNEAAGTTAYLLRISNAELLEAANDVLERIPVICPTPLAHGPSSYDMQGSSVDTDWTESNATDTVQTTAAEVQFGVQSLVVANSSANGYTQSTTGRIAHSERMIFRAIAKSDTGQGEFAIFDDSNNEEAAVNFTQEDWVYIQKEVTFGSTDEGCYVRLRGDGASDSIDWNAAWWVRPNVPYFRLPSWVDERFKVSALCYYEYIQPGDEADTWLADAFRAVNLREGLDWRFQAQYAAANSNQIWVERRDLMEKPLWLLVECPASAPYGVSTVFSTDASTTICPARLVVAALKQWLGEQYPQLFPLAGPMGAREYDAYSTARAQPPPPKEIRVHHMFST